MISESVKNNKKAAVLSCLQPYCLRCSATGHAAADCQAGRMDLTCIWCGLTGHLQLLCNPVTKLNGNSRATGA
jgi:hypothetical protein